MSEGPVPFLLIATFKNKKEINNQKKKKNEKQKRILKKKRKTKENEEKEASKGYTRDGSNSCFFFKKKKVTGNRAAIEVKKMQNIKKGKKTEPWTLKVALRPPGVVLVSKCFFVRLQ